MKKIGFPIDFSSIKTYLTHANNLIQNSGTAINTAVINLGSRLTSHIRNKIYTPWGLIRNTPTSSLSHNNLIEIFQALEQNGHHTERFMLTEALSRTSEFKNYKYPQIQFNRAETISDLPKVEDLLENLGYFSEKPGKEVFFKRLNSLIEKNAKNLEKISKKNKENTISYTKTLILENKEISSNVVREINKETLKKIENIFEKEVEKEGEIKEWINKGKTINKIKEKSIKFKNIETEEKNDRDTCFTAIKTKSKNIKYASEKIKSDHELVLLAVQESGFNLEYASSELKSDLNIVLAAVKQTGFALEYCADSLKDNHKIVMEAVQKDGLAIRYASAQMRANPEISLAAVRQEAFALMELNDELRNNHAIVLAAVSNKGNTLQYAHQNLTDNLEIVLAAVRNDKSAIQYASERLQTHPTVVAALS